MRVSPNHLKSLVPGAKAKFKFHPYEVGHLGLFAKKGVLMCKTFPVDT